MNPITYLEKHNRLAWILTILAAITIFVMSQLVFNVGTESGGVKSLTFLPVAHHFTAFFCLSLLLTISITKGRFNFKLFAICLLISTVYALTDEIHQFLVPGRWMDVKDIRIDILGIGIAQLIYALHLRKKVTTLK